MTLVLLEQHQSHDHVADRAGTVHGPCLFRTPLAPRLRERGKGVRDVIGVCWNA
jgi:hypothetical protein